jgi:ABC-2 type transport system permease protein
MRRIIQKYRYSVILLRELVRTDFKIRYQDSTLGYVWSLLRPLLLFLILYFVFTKFLRVGNDVPHYAVYLLLGIVYWNFFVELTVGSVGAIVGQSDLIRKINFPKYNIVLAKSFSALINLLLNFVVIAIFMIFSHVAPTWQAIILIPLIVEMYLLTIGVAFLLSALFVKFRDVTYVWDVVVQGAFYATPILYPLSRIPYHRVREILLLNPMAQIIQDARYVLVTHDTATISQVYNGNKWIWLIPISLTVLIVVIAALYFRSRSKYFAEEV